MADTILFEPEMSRSQEDDVKMVRAAQRCLEGILIRPGQRRGARTVYHRERHSKIPQPHALAGWKMDRLPRPG
jgi:hypothetical protein